MDSSKEGNNSLPEKKKKKKNPFKGFFFCLIFAFATEETVVAYINCEMCCVCDWVGNSFPFLKQKRS